MDSIPYSKQQVLSGLRNPHLITREILKQLVRNSPMFYNLFDYYVKKKHPTDFEGFAHPPDPFARIHVDPSSIERFTGREYPPWKNEKSMLGKVKDGEWDRSEPKFRESHGEEYRPIYKLFRSGSFSETPFYTSLEQHFLHGADWVETPFVRRCLELAAEDLPSWKGYTQKEQILKHCKKVDNLYETIREEGYKSQAELNKYPDPRSAAKEVTIDIGRDGELLFVNGRHRLTIAKLIQLDAIPVGVQVRHKEWMNYRDKVIDKNLPVEHPDLSC